METPQSSHSPKSQHSYLGFEVHRKVASKVCMATTSKQCQAHTAHLNNLRWGEDAETNEPPTAMMQLHQCLLLRKQDPSLVRSSLMRCFSSKSSPWPCFVCNVQPDNVNDINLLTDIAYKPSLRESLVRVVCCFHGHVLGCGSERPAGGLFYGLPSPNILLA